MEHQEVFSDVIRIKKLGLDVPQVTELLYELEKEGFCLARGVLTVDEAFDILSKFREQRTEQMMAIKVENLSYAYMERTPFEKSIGKYKYLNKKIDSLA